MGKVLLRAGKSPLVPLSHEQSLGVYPGGVFGTNTGNILFSSSVHRTLSVPDVEISVDGYYYERNQPTSSQIDQINSTYDRYVLPLANSFRPSFLPHLSRYTDFIRKLNIPVHIIGSGAQMGYGASFDSLGSEFIRVVSDFIYAVLDRSPSVGVRGEYTADLLRFIGIPHENIEIIGCPSMFSYGQAEPLRPLSHSLSGDAKVALNFTPTVRGMAQWLNRAVTKYPNSVVIPQQHQRLALLLWAESSSSSEDPRLPVTTDHWLYQRDQLRMFVDAEPWIKFLRDREFAAGTRIHGTIAAILARTPAVLLAFDSRTAELAQYHGIPHKITRNLEEGLELDELYQLVDSDTFAERQPVTFQNYVDFLNRHEIPHIFNDPAAATRYDEALAQADLPGPVSTLMAEGLTGKRQLHSRLAWLRQGNDGDLIRRSFPPDLPNSNHPRRVESANLERRIKKAEKALTRANKTNAKLQKRYRGLKKRLKRVELELEKNRRARPINRVKRLLRRIRRSTESG